MSVMYTQTGVISRLREKHTMSLAKKQQTNKQTKKLVKETLGEIRSLSIILYMYKYVLSLFYLSLSSPLLAATSEIARPFYI